MKKRVGIEKRTTEKRLITGCVFLVICGVLMLIAARQPDAAEWYSTHVYPIIVSTLGRFSGIFPFSLSELGLYVLIILLLGTFTHAVFRAFQGKQGGAVILNWAAGLFLTASVLMLLFVLNCGINYRRVPFSEKADMVTGSYTVEDLKRVSLLLTEEVNERADAVNRDTNGVMQLSGNDREEAAAAMTALGKKYSFLEGCYPIPKPLLVSEILSYQNLTGIYLPFAVEANYNQDMTAYNIPFTVCHELSHLRGFMQEEEANFIAFLACKDAAREDFQYSGYLMGWIYCMNALHSADTQAWQEVRGELAVNVEVDLKANSKFWSAYEGTIAEVSNQINDTYLKANGQSDGVQSYGRMVDLIVEYYQ